MKPPKTHRCLHTFFVGIAFLSTVALAGLIRAQEPPLIVDTHEHIESVDQAAALVAANQAVGIQKTILLASPTETLTLNGQKSFTGYRENMDQLLKVAAQYPDQFFPFCTVNPLDSDAQEYLQSCIQKGGKGIKLYNGHSYYHATFGITLDSKRMMPIYAYAERNQIPLLFHVNITKYGDELERVLEMYPDLVISVPHFMVSSIDLKNVADLLDRYPNLYTDISFGSPEFMAAGFRRISNDSNEYAGFINKYHDRILFGADMVLTDAAQKDQNFIEESLNCYKNLLEERHFTCQQVLDYYQSELKAKQDRFDACEPKEGDYCQSLRTGMDLRQQRVTDVTQLNGLNLGPALLREIYWENPNRFLSAEPAS